MQFADDRQHILEDTAYRLDSRSVVRIEGENSALELDRLFVGFDAASTKPAMAFVLDDEGFLKEDVFVVPREDHILIEYARPFRAELLKLLDSLDVSVVDVSDDWVVFGELPDQKTFDFAEPFIKYADPRPHVGSRILRPVSEALHSSQWGRELKWANHVLKLGFLPQIRTARDQGISLIEAGFHVLMSLDGSSLSEKQKRLLVAPSEELKQRVLPVRIEPNSASFPTLTGQEVLDGDRPIGRILAHYGLYAVGLIDIAPWRMALNGRRMIRVNGEPVMITWPSWLAQESRGRGGPVALSL